MDITERVVLVTGPQRSGTTIMSRMLAHDTGYKLMDESDWGVHDYQRWRRLVRTGKNLVVQCPTMVHKLEEVPRDVLIVMMVRPVEDIKRSERRINWGEDKLEAQKFGVDKDSAIAKYIWWDLRKGKMNYKEVDYGDEYMRNHPLWVEERKNFHPKQTEMVE